MAKSLVPGSIVYQAFWFHGQEPVITAFRLGKREDGDEPDCVCDHQQCRMFNAFPTVDAAREHIRAIARSRIARYEKMLADDVASTIKADLRWVNAKAIGIDMRTCEAVPISGEVRR